MLTHCNPAWLELALPLVRKWEGLKLKAYPDPGTGGKPWTVGYGATGPDIGPGTVWTLAKAETWLLNRLTHDALRIDGMVKPELAPNEMAALVSLAYNIGLANLERSTLLRKLNAGDRKGAAAEFVRWNRAGGREMRGLTNRRNDERKLFEGKA